MTDYNLLLKAFEAKFLEAVAERGAENFDMPLESYAADVGREVATMSEAGRVEFTHDELMTLLAMLHKVANGHWTDSYTEKQLAKAIDSRINEECWPRDFRHMARQTNSFMLEHQYE